MRFRAHALVCFVGMFLFLGGCPSGGGGSTSGGEGFDGEESGLDDGEETDIVTGEGNDSEILEHAFPESLVVGETSTAFVTVLNKGEHVWTAEDGYRLGAMGGEDPFAESVRMYLPDDVEVLPGDSWTFEILLTAPDVSGKYQTGWRMVQEHVEWFGHQVVVDVMVACVEDPEVEPVVPLDVPLCGADSSSFAPPFVDPCAKKTYQQVFGSGNTTCALDTAGEVSCWGHLYGGLGESPPGPFTQMSFAHHHVCAIRTDETVACWGADSSGDTNPPDGEFQQVSLGDGFSCGLRVDGSPVCWGKASYDLQEVPSGSYVQIDAGRDHVCVLQEDGLVTCWGSSSHGQSHVPCERFQQISAGGRTSCGILLDGGLLCWGMDWDVTPDPGDRFKAVIPAANHVCAVRVDGSVVCWGNTTTLDWAELPGNFQQVAGESYFICGLLEDCTLKCAGSNSSGQFDFTTNDSKVVEHGIPITLKSGEIVEAFVEMKNTGTSTWSEAEEFRLGALNDSDPFLAQNRVKLPEGVEVCPGENWVFEFSMVGLPIPGFYTSDWKMVREHVEWFGGVVSNDVKVSCPPGDESFSDCATGLAGLACDHLAFAEVGLGRDHACGILMDGSVMCWGKDHGAPPAGEFSAIDLGRDHACGLRVDGETECWGVNADGESDAPSGIFQQVSAGWRFTCGVRADGSIACWGRDDYGKGTPPSGEFQSVSAGVAHGCGVDALGAVVCWGKDEFGQSAGASGSVDFVSVGAGWRHSCGLRTDGSVHCWGDNANGQSEAPGGVFTSIAVGYIHTCAVRADGESVCWGSNFEGESAEVCGDFKGVGAGDKFSCGVHLDGRVDCWGKNTSGERNVPIP